MSYKKRKPLSKITSSAAALSGTSAALLSTSKAHAFGDGGSDGAGCGNDGNAGNDASPSCPFLCAWNGERYEFENDILHGKPTTLFASVEAALDMYRRRKVAGDRLKLSADLASNDKLHLQIREIEPEQSFLDHVAVERVCHARGTSVFVGGDASTMHIVPDERIKQRAGFASQQTLGPEGARMDRLSEALSRREPMSRANNPASLRLETGEAITVTGTLDRAGASTGDVFLFLESYYRDWTAGQLLDQNDAARLRGHGASPGHVHKAAVAAAVAGLVGGIGLFQHDLPMLSRDEGAHRFISTAHADGVSLRPKSLKVSYWDGAEWIHVETVTPRFCKPSVALVRIPGDACGRDGGVRLKVEATKRHLVTRCFLFRDTAPSKAVSCDIIRPSRAFHHREGRDHAELLSRRDEHFMRTIPADVVDLTFDLPSSGPGNDHETTLLFRSHGFYTPATGTIQREAGDWVRKLDRQSRAMLETMTYLGDLSHRRGFAGAA